jgi:hypothetical protein
MVTDAVKEAFMEVDEEAPGGWQGWRMWNDMVREEPNSVSEPAVGFDGGTQGAEMSWSAYDGSNFFAVDPIQVATIPMENYGIIDKPQWDFSGSR